METPIRSLTEAAGFWNSSLAAMVAPAPLLRRLIRTSGVLPTIDVTSSWMGTRDRLGCVGRQETTDLTNISLCLFQEQVMSCSVNASTLAQTGSRHSSHADADGR